MKIKIGDVVYNSEIQPIKIIFDSELEKSGLVELMLNDPKLLKFTSFPPGINTDVLERFIEE